MRLELNQRSIRYVASVLQTEHTWRWISNRRQKPTSDSVVKPGRKPYFWIQSTRSRVSTVPPASIRTQFAHWGFLFSGFSDHSEVRTHPANLIHWVGYFSNGVNITLAWAAPRAMSINREAKSIMIPLFRQHLLSLTRNKDVNIPCRASSNLQIRSRFLGCC